MSTRLRDIHVEIDQATWPRTAGVTCARSRLPLLPASRALDDRAQQPASRSLDRLLLENHAASDAAEARPGPVGQPQPDRRGSSVRPGWLPPTQPFERPAMRVRSTDSPGVVDRRSLDGGSPRGAGRGSRRGRGTDSPALHLPIGVEAVVRIGCQTSRRRPRSPRRALRACASIRADSVISLVARIGVVDEVVELRSGRGRGEA